MLPTSAIFTRNSPLVQRLARENNIDLATVRGTGAGGRISKQDIQAAIVARSSAHAPIAPSSQALPAVGASPTHGAFETALPRERIYFGRYEVHTLSVMRQKIAEHMVASVRVAPHVYSVEEADLTAIARLRAERKTKDSKGGTAPSLRSCPFLYAPVQTLCANSRP